jgi:hypothetical protein
MLDLPGTIAVFAIVGGFVSWFIITINMFRMVANRKDGVPLFPSWYKSPFGILFRPAQLTDHGRAARRLAIYGIIGFFVCWLIGMVFASMSESFTFCC